MSETKTPQRYRVNVTEAARLAGVQRRVIDYVVKTGVLPSQKNDRQHPEVSLTDLRVFLHAKYGNSTLKGDEEPASPTEASGTTVQTPSEASEKTGQPIRETEVSRNTLNALREENRQVRQELAVARSRIDELEQQLENERQRADETEQQMTELLSEANAFAGESGAGRSLDAWRDRELGGRS